MVPQALQVEIYELFKTQRGSLKHVGAIRRGYEAIHAARKEKEAKASPETHTCSDCGYTWKHGEHGGHSCTHYLSEEVAKLRAGLVLLDRQMTGGEIYEHGYANYPETPAKSPADYVRELIQSDWRTN